MSCIEVVIWVVFSITMLSRSACAFSHAARPVLRGKKFGSVASARNLRAGGDKSDICLSIEESVGGKLSQVLQPNAKLLLCVSGGSDSMAMLHIMSEIRTNNYPDLNLQVINFNHKARAESDEEAEFVRGWSHQYNMPFHSREAPLQLQRDPGFQTNAREWRRNECLAILEKQKSEALTLSKPGEHYICTAHNHEDNLETLMMKLLRGVNIANFQGMKALDGPFLKPVLHLPKAQLVQYLTQLGLEWREDRSNQERVYLRNKVRLDLMPLMAELAGNADALSARLMGLSQQSADLKVWIDAECENWSKNMIHSSNLLTNEHHTLAMREPLKFDAVPKLVLAELLHRWVKQHATVELSTERTEELVALAREPLPRGRAHKTIAVSKQYAVVRWHKDLRLTLRHPSPGS